MQPMTMYELLCEMPVLPDQYMIAKYGEILCAQAYLAKDYEVLRRTWTVNINYIATGRVLE